MKINCSFISMKILVKISHVFIWISIFTLILSCQKKNPEIIIKTELGDIVLELYADQAPITVANFLRYVDENRLDSSHFYRIVRNDNQEDNPIKIQVIQGGLYEDEHPKMLAPIEHENTQNTGVKHLRGVISMARYHPGTATSEFFICVEEEPELDFGGMRNGDGAGFAAFGKVVKGMDLVDEIHRRPAQGQMLQPRIKIIEVYRNTK